LDGFVLVVEDGIVLVEEIDIALAVEIELVGEKNSKELGSLMVNKRTVARLV